MKTYSETLLEEQVERLKRDNKDCADVSMSLRSEIRQLRAENAALQELAARRAEIIDIMNRDAASRVSDAVKKLKQENNILRSALENIASMSEVLPRSTDEGAFARLTLDAVSDNPPPVSFEAKKGGAT
jgi:uncharacterized protein YukE